MPRPNDSEEEEIIVIVSWERVIVAIRRDAAKNDPDPQKGQPSTGEEDSSGSEESQGKGT